MWLLIRKWWFLQRLERQISFHTRKQNLRKILNGLTILSTKEFFINGNEAYPGIAKRPLGKYLSWILFWRWFESKERYNERAYKYMKFFDYWEKEGCVSINQAIMEIDQGGNVIKVGVNMPNLSSKADDVHGLVGLMELIQETYPLTWSSMWKLVAFVITSAGGLMIVIAGIIKLIFH